MKRFAFNRYIVVFLLLIAITVSGCGHTVPISADPEIQYNSRPMDLYEVLIDSEEKGGQQTEKGAVRTPAELINLYVSHMPVNEIGYGEVTFFPGKAPGSDYQLIFRGVYREDGTVVIDETNWSDPPLASSELSEDNLVICAESIIKTGDRTTRKYLFAKVRIPGNKTDNEGGCVRFYDRFSPHCGVASSEFEVTMASYPDTVIKNVGGVVYANERQLVGGVGYVCTSFYASDLNKDGHPELAFGMALGSGMVDMRVVILDLTTGRQLFELNGCHKQLDYLLFVRDGQLCVREVSFPTLVREENQEVLRTGTIVCKDDAIEVVWDETADYREDDQPDKTGNPVP